MSSLYIKLTCMAGTEIQADARDAVDFCTRTGVGCDFDFNGITVMARPGDLPGKLVDQWYAAMHRKKTNCAVGAVW